MKPRTRKTVIGATCAVAAVAVAVLLAPASIGRPPSPDARGTGSCLDLAADVDPRDVPVDTGYDPEADLVYAHALGKTYAMRPDDPQCRALAPVRSLIEDTMDAHAENQRAACAAMTRIVQERRIEFRGRRVDQAAAQRFLDRRCGATAP